MADVVEDHQPLIGDAVVDGSDGLILVVEKLPGANTTDVTEGVEAALADLGPGLDGITVDTGIYRPATYVDKVSDNLGRTALIGGVLLLIGLVAFVFNWRRALICLIAIAFSLLAAGFVIYCVGVELQRPHDRRARHGVGRSGRRRRRQRRQRGPPGARCAAGR